jgi:transketolase
VVTLIPSAFEIRLEILKMSFSGQTVHVPSAFSIVEILKVLHEDYVRYPSNNPSSSSRDYLVLSKGHGIMALYPILLSRGWISQLEIESYFKDGSSLPGLCESHIPGCEVNSGSLGQAFSTAVGLAYSSRLQGTHQQTFCVVGDGELNEGAFWEALMFAAHKQLDNLTLIIDQNKFQAMGSTAEVLEIQNLAGALDSLGFRVREIDGHDEWAIRESLASRNELSNRKPTAIIARTVKGRGVSFMEYNNEWHYTRLTSDTFARAVAELEQKK